MRPVREDEFEQQQRIGHSPAPGALLLCMGSRRRRRCFCLENSDPTCTEAGVVCRVARVSADPTQTDPDKYKVVFENDRIRVLEYRDKPGDRTSPHGHPDSVMYTLSSFERRLIHGDRQRDVRLETGRVVWIAAQEHSGENIGTTESHSVFVELKEPPPGSSERSTHLGPASGS
jgi:quercetin dioxygenase-like cupin family protein